MPDPVDAMREATRVVEAYQEALAALVKKSGGTLIVDIRGVAASGKLHMTVRDGVATFRLRPCLSSPWRRILHYQ